MNIPNYVKETLFQGKSYIMDMTKASEKLFDSIDDTFFKGNNREVKVLRCSDDSGIYVLDKHGKQLNVHWEQIEDFQKDKSTKELLHYDMLRLEEYEKNQKDEDNGELYILNIHGSKRSKFLEQIENGTYLEEKTDNEFEKQIQKAKDMGLDQAFIDKILKLAPTLNSDPQVNLEKQYDFKCSSHVEILRDYTKLLNDKNFLDTKFEDNFFKGLNRKGYAKRDQKLPSMWKTINYLTDICQYNNLLNSAQKFSYNDGDNSIYMYNDHLVVADQTCGYYFDIQNKNNYKIYFLEKEYKDLSNEIVRIENELKNNTIDELKSVVLEVKDGKTVFQNDVFVYILDLCFQYGPEAIISEGLKSKAPRKKKM